MAETVIKELTDRELELVAGAAGRVASAQQQSQAALESSRAMQTLYFEALELVTGDDDPKTLKVDIDKKRITREKKAKPRRRAKPKSKAKPNG